MIDSHNSIADALMDVYQNMGDALTSQYGGSTAHNIVFLERWQENSPFGSWILIIPYIMGIMVMIHMHMMLGIRSIFCFGKK